VQRAKHSEKGNRHRASKGVRAKQRNSERTSIVRQGEQFGSGLGKKEGKKKKEPSWSLR